MESACSKHPHKATSKAGPGRARGPGALLSLAAFACAAAAACTDLLGVHDAVLGSSSGAGTGATSTTGPGGTGGTAGSGGGSSSSGGTGGTTTTGGTGGTTTSTAGSGGSSSSSGGVGGGGTGGGGTGGTSIFGACGDHVLQQANGEECDDGNNMSGDGCSATCAIEAAYQIDAGDAHTCVRFSGSGKLKCWGENESNVGRLGAGLTAYAIGDDPNEMGASLKTDDLGSAVTLQRFNCASSHSCALLDAGDVKCWGANDNGRLGLGDTMPRGFSPPQMGDALPKVALGGAVAALSSGRGSHTCAILSDGTLKCWGANGNGQLGYEDTDDRGDVAGEIDLLKGVKLAAGDLAVSVFTGAAFTCALLKDSTVKCWGFNGNGQLGWDPPARLNVGIKVGDMGDAVQATVLSQNGFGAVQTLALGFDHACALSTTGKVKCWGANSHGQLGQGNSASIGIGQNDMLSLQPVAIAPAKAIVAGSHHTCALLMDGSVLCWGQNGDGQLGYGDTKDRCLQPNDMADLMPVDLGPGAKAVALTAGDQHTCAVLADGHVKCWGGNVAGQLGYGDKNKRGDSGGEMGDNLKPLDLGQ
jgi:cysteine-rich repeat protein